MNNSKNPSAWEILSNTGTAMSARNRQTGEVFTGSPDAFRTKLQNEAGDYDFVRLNAQKQLVDSLGQVVGGRVRRFQNRAALHHQQRIQAAGSLSNRTTHTIAMAPVDEFVMARLILKNNEDSAIPVDACALAVTNSATTNEQCIVSSQGTGLTGDSATGWVRATFGGSNTVTLPPRLAVNRPSLTFSDWMPVQSIPPVDGRRRPYIMGRVYVPGNLYSFTDAGTQENEPAGIWQKNFVQNVSGSSAGTPLGITTPSSFTTSTTTPNTTIAGFEFLTSERAMSIAVGGDSITQGQSVSYDSPYAYACENLRAAGLDVSLFNLAWPSQNSSQYAQHGFDVLPSILPDYYFYSVYTPNESISESVSNQLYARAMQVAQFCLERHITPVFSFLAPNNNLNATQDDLLVSLMNRCKASGVAVMDCTPTVSTTETPRRWLPGLNDDALHPSTAGKIAMGQFISDWIGANLQRPPASTLV